MMLRAHLTDYAHKARKYIKKHRLRNEAFIYPGEQSLGENKS
jgi:hypothetical protein